MASPEDPFQGQNLSKFAASPAEAITHALKVLASTRVDDDVTLSLECIIEAINFDPRRGTRDLSAALMMQPKGAQKLIEVLERNPKTTVGFFAKFAPSEAAALLRQLHAQDPIESDRLFQLLQCENPQQAQELYMSFSDAHRGGYFPEELHSGPYNSIDGITFAKEFTKNSTYKFVR